MSPNRLALTAALAVSVSAAFAAEVRHNYDLKNVLWRLDLSMEKGTIAGDVTNTLTLTEDTSTVELSCSELEVTSVWINGHRADFTNADGVLRVTLPNSGKAGDTLHIRAIYTGAPVTGFYFVPASRAFPAHTGMVYTQGEGEDNHYWLPTYDKPDDKATTECFVTVPKSWTAISNGKLMDVAPAGEKRIFHWKMDQPYSTYLISLVAGEYVEGRAKWRNTPVSYFVPPGLEEEGKIAFSDTPKMIEYYSKLTGVDYPYAKFAQETVADFMFGGMENVTAVTQTIKTLHPKSAEPVSDSTNLVAHELAHHWFGDLITCRTWEYTWLNEGFATTLPVMLDRAWHGKDVFDYDRYTNLEGAVDTIGSRNRKDLPTTAGTSPTINIGSAYPGGCSRIFLLMYELGEPVFWRGIHAFLERYKFQPATTDEFFAVMSQASGTDLTAFKKQWFYTTATPSLTVSVVGRDLLVHQLAPYYTMDLPVWFLDQAGHGASARWTEKTIHIEGADSKLALGALGDRPMLVDPESWVPMELHYDTSFTPEQILDLYRSAPNVTTRARIIAEFSSRLNVSQRIALGREDKFYGLLSMLTGRVGKEGLSYLLLLSHHPDKRVVNAALSAMEKLEPGTVPASVLTELAEHDSNDMIREHATQILLNRSSDPSFAQEVSARKAFDDRYRVMALNWFAAHRPDEARRQALAIVKTPDSEPLRIAAIQALGRLNEGAFRHDVFDALTAVAKETSFGARRAAIDALGQLGNKAAIPVLEPITLHAPNGIKGAAQAAIKRLSASR